MTRIRIGPSTPGRGIGDLCVEKPYEQQGRARKKKAEGVRRKQGAAGVRRLNAGGGRGGVPQDLVLEIEFQRVPRYLTGESLH